MFCMLIVHSNCCGVMDLQLMGMPVIVPRIFQWVHSSRVSSVWIKDQEFESKMLFRGARMLEDGGSQHMNQ